MVNIPKELKYTKSHEWVKQEADGSYRVGITDYAQSKLGDFVFIDLPEVGAEFKAEEECCVTESVKAASDVYMPVAGTIKAVNTNLESSPELVNKDTYGEGWLFSIEPANPDDINELLDAAACEELEKSE